MGKYLFIRQYSVQDIIEGKTKSIMLRYIYS